MTKAAAAASRMLLVVCFLVCPLLFFTNLTRNPYVTQICLLNICLALAALAFLLKDYLERGELRLPQTPLDWPIGIWLVVCALSWGWGYVNHAEFFRPAIVNEGVRQTLFLLVNALIPFYLASALASAPEEKPDSVGPWIVFALVWGGLWFLFPSLRGRHGGSVSVWANVWDGYGALLWGGGLVAAGWLCRKGRVEDFIHLVLAVGFLASIYGVLQYFNKEIFWPQTLNPYGGRSVSTFGNPNFMSSFNVVLLPIALLSFLQARAPSARLAYGAVFLALEAALLCSMTRSSWMGGLIAVALLSVSREVRAKVMEGARGNGLLLAAAAAVVAFWPQSSIASGYTPGVLGRLSEMVTFPRAYGHYSPFHQRLLIWTCAWLMGAENPLLGKGWGLFELFYPFYQGPVLNATPFYVPMRTHANNSHNEIMETWAQTGILGLGTQAWLWIAFFWLVWRRWVKDDAGGRGLGLAAAAGAAGMLVDNLLNVSLHFAVPGFMFWWAAGLAVGRAFQGEMRWRSAVPGAKAGVLAVLAASGALAVSWYWVKTWNREVNYFAGFKLLRQNVFPAAIKRLEDSRAWGPPEVNAVYELGNAFARSERFEDAVRIYHEALRANAGYDEIYFNIATLLAAKLGRQPEALQYYRMAWWINPVSADLYNNLSAYFLQDPPRHRAEAEKLLESAARFFPDNPNHWNNLGYLYSLAGRSDGAESAYARALALNPDMVIAEKNLAASLARSGHPAPPIYAALADLRALEARFAKGDASADAVALAARVVERLPDLPRARFYYGTLLVATGKFQEGTPHLEWSLAREPRNVSARINLANGYLGMGRPGDAVAQYRAVLGIDPGNAFALERLKAMGASP